MNHPPTVLVDWSVIAYNSWHKMNAQGYVAKTKHEIAEFARNMALAVIELMGCFSDAQEVIFFVEGDGNWRNQFVKDHYRKHTQGWWDPDTGTSVVCIDKVWHEISKSAFAGKYVAKKFTAKERDEFQNVLATEGNSWVPMDFSRMQDYPIEVYGVIRSLIPFYKGNRSGNWKNKTPKEEFKATREKLAYSLAGAWGAKVIKADNCEADDAIATYVTMNPTQDLVLITVDSDLHQLVLVNPFLRVMDYTHRTMVPLDIASARFNITKKIIAGDSADNINGLYLKTGKQRISNTGAEKMLMVHKDKIFEHLNKVIDPEVVQKNLALVWLGNIPQEAKDACTKAINEAPKQSNAWEWSDYHVDDDARLEKGRHGLNLRRKLALDPEFPET